MVLLETFINPISELPLSISTSIQAKDMIGDCKGSNKDICWKAHWY